MNATTKSYEIDLTRKLTVDTEELQQILSLGRKSAVEIGNMAGARIVVGKRIVWNLVFPSDTGYPMNRDRLKVQVNKIIESIHEAGHEFEHITPHTWGHSFATRCIENGMQPKVLQKILGHSKISQTMDLYVHTEDDFKVEEMKKIANLF